MKHLKMLVLTGLVAVAALACAGVGSASATVLCKTTANPCPAGWNVTAGTEVDASLVPAASSIFESTDKETINVTCTESTISLTTENTGSATETVRGAIGKWTWGGCTGKKLVTLKTGQFEFHYIAGTGTATITDKGTEFTVETVFGADCNYGSVGGTLDFGVTREPSGSETQSQIEMLADMPKLAGGIGCPADALITARYRITTPVPLYASGS